eukprot:scaffold43227_cov29-Tisochrysis_lutea.AAC.4
MRDRSLAQSPKLTARQSATRRHTPPAARRIPPARAHTTRTTPAPAPHARTYTNTHYFLAISVILSTVSFGISNHRWSLVMGFNATPFRYSRLQRILTLYKMDLQRCFAS